MWSGSRPEARVRPGTLFTLFLLFVAAVLLAQTRALAPLSRVAPLWVLVPTAALTVVQLFRDARNALRHETEPATAAIRLRQLRITLWIAAATALVYLLGLLIGSAVFLLLYIRAESSTGWRQSLLVTAATISAIYLVFVVLADMRFPAGALF